MFFKRILKCLFACNVLCFCFIASLYCWCSWCFWCVQKLFVKKRKEFKTDLISSFTLPLKFILIKAWFFLITIFINHHNPFASSQSFSIITIFFNYYNLFQLSQSFSIITIFFITMFFITIFFNLFTTCDTIIMKISQRTNSII